jgi:hypothetical protein
MYDTYVWQTLTLCVYATYKKVQETVTLVMYATHKNLWQKLTLLMYATHKKGVVCDPGYQRIRDGNFNFVQRRRIYGLFIYIYVNSAL